jgi:hypothetical protein
MRNGEFEILYSAFELPARFRKSSPALGLTGRNRGAMIILGEKEKVQDFRQRIMKAFSK